MLVGAVLAGGDSRRMGTPKALLQVDGVALAARVAGALELGGATRLVLVGGDPSWAEALDLAHVPDRWPGLGPLGGLASAISSAADDVVVVAACDQAGLSGPLVARLVAALAAADPGVVASAPVMPDGRRQPFPSAWRAGSGAALAALVDVGARRADAAFGVGPVVDVPASEDELVDLDTPADLARWEQRHGNGPEGPGTVPYTPG